MDKTLLSQALKFKSSTPTYSQTPYFNKVVKRYQKDNDIYFVELKSRSRSRVLDREEFFSFLSEMGNAGKNIYSFEDIELLLSPTNSRKENVKNSGDSKSRYISVFDGVVIFQHNNQEPRIYQKPDDIVVEDGAILAVENAESFLNIYDTISNFHYVQYVYLGGMSNRATREFLKDKRVVFFLDYDIEAIRIYDSFKCINKSFFKHPDIEKYFANEKYQNRKLYRKQLSKLPKRHDELQWLIELINKYSAVIEQEVF